MANIPNAPNALPGVITNIETQSTGTSVPGGVRVTSIIGLGARNEMIVPSANGDGYDGFNAAYTSSNGSDGRHFTLNFFPVVSNRTQIFKNGLPLVGLEAKIDSNSFSSTYDYRIDPATGHIELQTAHIIDQGGTDYTIGPSNVGIGTIQNLSLVDVNAPNETWTIKCVSVQRGNTNQPIAGTAKFVAFGSVSGNILDANGNPVLWSANNTVATNTVLKFSILETVSGSSVQSAFREGDYFTIKVYSGVLNKNDTLTSVYIAVNDINTPTFFSDMRSITNKHGLVSLNNTLSLGCQIAFANTTPGIMCVEAAPALPRRVSYELETAFKGTSTNVNDFVIPFPLGVSPDINSNIHIFVTNPATGVEKQLLANKFPFFTIGTSGQPTLSQFVFDNVAAPAGNSFAYSVVQENASLNFAQDGYLNRSLISQTNAIFTSDSVSFDSTYENKTLNVIDANNLANIGSFVISEVVDGYAVVVANSTPPFADFINETNITFNLVDPIFGAVVASSTGTDGSVVASANTATGAFHSTSVVFSDFNVVADGYKLQITASTNATNIGLFDITAYNSGTNTLTIAKSFVSEHGLKFEIIDSAQTSDFLVLNHNVVPNGYSLRATVVDTKDSSFFDAGWENALASLEPQEVDIVVPLPKQTISVIFQNTLSHCTTMSNALNRKERVAFIGAINGLTPDNLLGNSLAAVEDIGVLEGIQGETISDILSGNTEDLANYSVANAYGNTFRAVYFFPDQIVVQVGSDAQIIDGFYQAAAAGGYCSGQVNIAMPLTNKTLSGFTILQNRMFSQTVYQNLALAGVTSVVPVSGAGEVVWGITTTQNGFAVEQEISSIFIRDRLAKSLRAGMKAFIGIPEDKDTQGTLLARANALFQAFIEQGLILSYTNLVVAQDTVDPRQWNVGAACVLVSPINWIFISVGVS